MVGGPLTPGQNMLKSVNNASRCSGVLTAEGLAQVFVDLFGGVVYAGIDTDRFK